MCDSSIALTHKFQRRFASLSNAAASSAPHEWARKRPLPDAGVSHMFSKQLLSGAALTALTISMGGTAYAQSTASQIQEDEEIIIVTGQRMNLNGAMVA